MDTTGPISPPSDGYKYILTTIDMCTRFPEAVPSTVEVAICVDVVGPIKYILTNIDMCTRFPDIHASTAAEALLEIFSPVGLPYKIHSDHGSQFTSSDCYVTLIK